MEPSKLEAIVAGSLLHKGQYKGQDKVPLAAFYLEKQPLAKKGYTCMGNSYCQKHDGSFVRDD